MSAIACVSGIRVEGFPYVLILFLFIIIRQRSSLMYYPLSACEQAVRCRTNSTYLLPCFCCMTAFGGFCPPHWSLLGLGSGSRLLCEPPLAQVVREELLVISRFWALNSRNEEWEKNRTLDARVALVERYLMSLSTPLGSVWLSRLNFR